MYVCTFQNYQQINKQSTDAMVQNYYGLNAYVSLNFMQKPTQQYCGSTLQGN